MLTAFNLDFGDSSESTGIREINTDPAPRSAEGRLPLGDDRRRLPKQEGKNPSPTGVGRSAWYSLDGRKLDGKPTVKGLYIHEGRKVVIP